MKKSILLLMVGILVAGTALAATSAPSFAQATAEVRIETRPKVVDARPWIGEGTPWVYYNGDWFYKGTLYYDYGPKYGWAPYYSYETTSVTRPPEYYDTKVTTWYEERPTYQETFVTTYPYYREHKVGTVYKENFYIEHDVGGGENRWRKAWHELRRED